jgi:hypothetical protein
MTILSIKWFYYFVHRLDTSGSRHKAEVTKKQDVGNRGGRPLKKADFEW